MEKISKFEDLIDIMEKLRSKDGCPWDREQNLESLKPYLIEEAYEVLEAMEEGPEKLKDELGDLLLQIIFQSQIMKEEGKFDIFDVIDILSSKLRRRHPHVFSDTLVKDSNEVSKNWDEIKKKEKTHENRKSVIDGIPKYIPNIIKASKIQSKAAKVGFDFNNPKDAMEKVNEEIEELNDAILKDDKLNMEEEFGDLIFSIINTARLMNIDINESLAKTIKKFDRRFRYVEKNVDFENTDILEMEKYWEKAKNENR